MEKTFSYHNWNKTRKDVLMLDSKENPIDSLETAVEFFSRDDNLKWKWIILSLHHALYLFCIANLEGTSNAEVLSNGYGDDENTYFQRGIEKWKKSKKVPRGDGYTIAWEEIEGEPRTSIKNYKRKFNKLINFWTAIARVQDGELYMKRFIHAEPLELSNEEWESIEKLNYFRNEFTHYIPTSYAITNEELKEICFNIIRPIEFLALKTNQIIFFDSGQKERIKSALNKLKSLLK